MVEETTIKKDIQVMIAIHIRLILVEFQQLIHSNLVRLTDIIFIFYFKLSSMWLMEWLLLHDRHSTVIKISLFYYSDQIPVGILNPLVIQCIGYLNQQECLNEPGLFRIPGDMSIMKQYRASFARGQSVYIT